MAFTYDSSSKGTQQMYDKVNYMVSEIRLDQYKKGQDPLSKPDIE